MTERIARYTLTVYVDRPLMYLDDNGNEVEPRQEELDLELTAEVKRQLERDVLQALRKLDGDCDCEVVDAEIEEV